jgi:tRNA-2-methylthio-N6-dimethylallyladenosine synthase
MAYIFKYSPRPGTPSFELADDVTPEEKTRRFLELEKLQKHNQSKALNRLFNKTVEVLAEKKSPKNEGELSGHTTCHKVVNFKGLDSEIGMLKAVRISEVKSNTLYGEAT